MKVSIWQQFSSNNSSDFTIIGVFDEPDTAEKASDALKNIFQRIQTWYQNNPELANKLYDDFNRYPLPLTLVEKEIAKEYGVRWDGGIDWYDKVKVSVLLDRVVIVQPRPHVDGSPDPFDQIVNRLGGQGFVSGTTAGGDPFGTTTFIVGCEAPDNATVEAIKADKQPKPSKLSHQPQHTSLSVYEHHLTFTWDYDAGEWDLSELVSYLRKKHCKQITFTVSGVRYTDTNVYYLDEPDSEA